ncbi:MAG: nucleotide disphospho-sugar-binding domain-containing protein [Ktedonobacteraceae bacterium]
MRMARAVIIPLPAYGHVNPTLPLAQQLGAHGEEVIYCLPDQFKASIHSTGAAFLPFKITGREFRWSPVPCAELLLWLPLHTAVTSLEVLPQLLESVRTAQPDYIIYDAWCLWGRLVAHLLHLPAIRCQPTFVMNEQLGQPFWTMIEQANRLAMPRVSQAPPSVFEQQINFGAALEELCSSYHVPVIDLKSFFDHAEALNLVPIPRAFQPGGETFDDRFQFVGPSLLPHDEGRDFPLDRLKKQPTLYISLGTVCNDEEAFYKMCFAAFGAGSRATTGERPFSRTGEQAHQPPWQVVLATGKSDLGVLGVPPENFLVRPRVPQLGVLQHSSVFLTHGGMNSVMEGLYYGVPLVVIPQMLEQRITAKRVEELGLGIALDSNAVTVDRLQEAVRRVASEPQFRTRVQHMRDIIRESGGAHRAAEAIIQFTRTTGQRGWSWAPHPGHQ